MTNARSEFIEHLIEVSKKVKCAKIFGCESYNPRINPLGFNLKAGYGESDYELFLSQIDIKYDSGYGGQELDGTIWFDDGSFSERGEYDGSEWWEHKETPEIPEELLTPLLKQDTK